MGILPIRNSPDFCLSDTLSYTAHGNAQEASQKHNNDVSLPDANLRRYPTSGGIESLSQAYSERIDFL